MIILSPGSNKLILDHNYNDCPPSKRGGFYSAHADLDGAIAKLRMTAYMWQALTAEDMRSKDLGRRSFRFVDR